MSRDREYLVDLFEAARLARAYLEGKSKEEFLKDVQCQDAVIRRLEIIGEAARRVSADTTEILPQIPWPAMIGMRNILIHRYDDLDLPAVWNSVHEALPDVIEVIQSFLDSGSGGQNGDPTTTVGVR